MDLLLIFLPLILLYVSLLLIGSHECFLGTWVERLHYALTDGVCDALEASVDAACGRRGTACLAATEESCCRGSNPLGQLFFIGLFMGCYLSAEVGVFPLLALTGMGQMYRVVGLMGAALCMGFFLLVSFSDPGKIDSANLAGHMALYPRDGVLFPPDARRCSTCARPKPGRSKHCNATQACVARFDHWCIWINNAVGMLNTRWFLAFLGATAAICLYGAGLSAAVIAADMQRTGAWDLEWVGKKSGRPVRVRDHWGLAAQYISSRYSIAAGLAVFMGIAFLVVLGFTVAQLHRVGTGVTTNESWKIKELPAEARARLKAAGHPYHRGWRRNFAEVFVPHRYLRRALALHGAADVKKQG